MSLDNETVTLIQSQINDNPVLLYMKGSPEQPQCGFSHRAVQVLKACNVAFNHVDVLANPNIRATLPKLMNWPTFPQLYVRGNLVGGSDILMEMYQTGELQTLLSQPTQ